MPDTPFLADPSTLPPYTRKGNLQVIIETPAGSRNKYTFDHRRRLFTLKKILPAGMAFPFDFGFVPGTLGGDDDPLDVLVLMEEPTFPGCVLEARVLGIIRAEDHLPSGKIRRNDRLLAAAIASHLYAETHTLDDLPAPLLHHLEQFFVSYPALLGNKEYHLLGLAGPEEATRLIEEARLRASQASHPKKKNG